MAEALLSFSNGGAYRAPPDGELTASDGFQVAEVRVPFPVTQD